MVSLSNFVSMVMFFAISIDRRTCKDPFSAVPWSLPEHKRKSQRLYSLNPLYFKSPFTKGG